MTLIAIWAVCSLTIVAIALPIARTYEHRIAFKMLAGQDDG